MFQIFLGNGNREVDKMDKSMASWNIHSSYYSHLYAELCSLSYVLKSLVCHLSPSTRLLQDRDLGSLFFNCIHCTQL